MIAMKVLIAVERDACADTIAKLMSKHFWEAHREFLVIKVLTPLQASAPVNFLPPPVIADIEAERQKLAESLVQRVAGRIAELLHCANVDWQVKTGFVAETILETAQEYQPDLIVLGAGKRSHKSIFGLYGSVLGDIAAHATCPLLVARPPEALTETDGKESSAVQEARPKATRIVL
jgi:nucleotide-binding universal stress UspA family protein